MLEKPARGERSAHDATVVKRGSRKHHDEGHGGAWKVAFADFCLALLSLFLVLWLMAAREQEKLQLIMRAPGGNLVDEGMGHMSESVGNPRGSLLETLPMPRFGNAPAGAMAAASQSAAKPNTPSPKEHYETPTELQALARTLEKLSADAGLSGNLQTVVTAYGLRVMLHDTERQGMFERGSAVVNPRFVELLRSMGPLFARMDNQMLIVGHTDSLPYANRGHMAFSNWALSSNRAMAARSQLLVGGMAAGGILQVVGMADRAPLDSADATAGVNRRIELLILTHGQAGTIAAMFGAPGAVQPLAPGVDSALPDERALQALRNRIVDQKGGIAEVN